MTAPDWAHRALDEIETDDPRTFAEIISALDDHAQRRFHADQHGWETAQ